MRFSKMAVIEATVVAQRSARVYKETGCVSKRSCVLKLNVGTRPFMTLMAISLEIEKSSVAPARKP